MKRSEVKKEFTWAIEDLYSTDELWEKDYNRLKEMIPQIESIVADYQNQEKPYWIF